MTPFKNFLRDTVVPGFAWVFGFLAVAMFVLLTLYILARNTGFI